VTKLVHKSVIVVEPNLGVFMLQIY